MNCSASFLIWLFGERECARALTMFSMSYCFIAEDEGSMCMSYNY